VLAVLGVLFLGITSCRTSYRPPSRRGSTELEPGWPKGDEFFRQASYSKLQASIPEIPGAEYVNDDELCLECHRTYAEAFQHTIHRAEGCEKCHGPASRHLETRGKEPGLIRNFKTMEPAQRSEVCLTCHEENQCSPGAQFRYSKHAHCGVACTDCHRGHYNVPPGTPATTEVGESAYYQQPSPMQLTSYTAEADAGADMEAIRAASHNMGAVAPGICYKCHGDFQVYQEVAGPHQICGPNGFNCTTCHDPHSKIKEHTRTELCLQCHQGAPTMAWHSSTHYMENVACTDCHNPHPSVCVPRVVDINQWDIRRPVRRQMAVQQPEACYKCHQDIYALTEMPSHHPIREGKMVCSDCHDAHGQYEDNLVQDSINYVCYKCHADKEGPFAYEHPPVSENCAYCHNPHGAVANNLLRQPPTFLCLRCHSGHRGGPSFHERGLLPDFGNDPARQAAFYTDCTQCHKQVHGSDLPSPHKPQVMFR